jgi:hypothetical protein
MGAAASMAVIYSVFKEGERLRAAEIEARTGLAISYVNRLARRMTATDNALLARARIGGQSQHGGSTEFEYFRACDFVTHETVLIEKGILRRHARPVVVEKPYPRVLLGVPPADAEIGRAMWTLYDLCMAARR